jgi:hypothetical protein
MIVHFFDFAKQNQKNGQSFKIFLDGVSRQGPFETGSRGILGALGEAPRAYCGKAHAKGSFETALNKKKSRSRSAAGIFFVKTLVGPQVRRAPFSAVGPRRRNKLHGLFAQPLTFETARIAALNSSPGRLLPPIPVADL